MIYIDREIPEVAKTRLIARATLDKRLNARDLKVYSYVTYFSNTSRTQEEIADMLDMSRSNINKSLEKLSTFNYVEKREIQPAKQMVYAVIGMQNNPGVSLFTPDNIMRLGNLIKQKDVKSFNWISTDGVRKLEEELALINEEIEVLKKIEKETNEERIENLVIHLRMTQHRFMLEGKKTAKERIKELEYMKEKIDEQLEDTRYIERELNKFKKRYPSSSKVLTQGQVIEVLKDENALFVLFIDTCEDKRIVRFKEKYLEDYIKLLCRFTELAKNRDFFRLYYENKVEGFVFEDLMRVAEEKHREVPRIRGSFRFNLSKKLGDLHRDMIKVNKELDGEIVKESLIDKIEILEDEIYIVSLDAKEAKGRIEGLNVLNIRDFLLCVHALELEQRFEESYAIPFEDFMKMFDVELHEELYRYKDAKVKINIEKVEQDNKEEKAG